MASGDVHALEALAVERVVVGDGDAPRLGGVVGVPDEVDPAEHLRRGEGPRLDHRRVVLLVGVRRPGAAEGGVEVVDPGIDDPDPDALAMDRRSQRRPGLVAAHEGHR
jgi:hypothetical protein